MRGLCDNTGNRCLLALAAMALLAALGSAPASGPGNSGTGAAGQACCCCAAGDLSVAAAGACPCSCGDDACQTASCPGVSRSVQPLLGSVWNFDRPAGPWLPVPTSGQGAITRSILPAVPPPIPA